MTRSISFKLAGAFLSVSLIGIVMVAILLRVATPGQVDDVIRTREVAGLAMEFSTFYEEHQSWDDIRNLYSTTASQRNFQYLLFDIRGEAVQLGNRPLPPDSPGLPRSAFDQAHEITVNGKVVGYLINDEEYRRVLADSFNRGNDRNSRGNFSPGPERPGGSIAEDFIQRFTVLLAAGAIGAVSVSLVASIILARTLTRPLKRLTEATENLAAGSLGHSVDIRSNDEIGALATSFNQMSRQLKEARELRQQMTADIAHELRTPLSIILGHAEALSDGVFQPTPERLAVIHEEAQRLDHLIEDLRILAMSDAGELKLRHEVLKASELIERSAEGFRPLAMKKGIQISVDVAEDIPEVVADPSRVAQVIGNLISNAMRYASDGGHVWLSATRAAANMVAFSVRDSGKGIAEEDIPHLFHRFYRADKARARVEGGSGLGLAIARSIVEAHGGTIAVTNASEGGAVFTFTLPAK